MGGKNSAPPAPDYAALAAQQGSESRDTAAYNAAINRVDQYGPQGSVTWSVRPGADPNNPQPGDYIQNTQLSPEQQGLYNSQNQISQNMLNVGMAGMDRVGQAQAQPFDMSQMSQFYGAPQTQQTGYGNVQGQIDMSGVRQLSGNADDASRQRVEEAMMARLNPQFEDQESALRDKMLNSGIPVGSDAWNAEMSRLDQSRNDARTQMVLAGGQEESRQIGLNQGLQGQEFQQAMGRGQFANAANAQQFAQMLGANNQNYQQALAQAQFGNQARSQSMQEQAYLRQLPLNELNALRTGGQVSMPQFQSYYTGGQAQASPYFDAGVAQGNYDLARYGTQQGGQNALWGGLANLGSAWLMSDLRLKSALTRLGSHPSGVGRYSWTWADGSPGFGVIAQDIQQAHPEAVREVAGYLAVNYSAIGGW